MRYNVATSNGTLGSVQSGHFVTSFHRQRLSTACCSTLGIRRPNKTSARPKILAKQLCDCTALGGCP